MIAHLDSKVCHRPYFYLYILTVLQMNFLRVPTGHVKGALMKMFVTKFSSLRQISISVA